VGVAAELNLEVHDPCVLKDSNNTVVWLRPLPVVAKVATSFARDDGGLARELSVLAHLEGADAPVARLARDLEPKLHVHDGLTVLLLTYIEFDHTLDVPAGIAHATLSAVHEALRDFPGPLPTFTEQLARAQELLINPARTSDLSTAQRHKLLTLTQEFSDALTMESGWRPLHGDPWPGGNMLRTTTGAVLLDFEAACLGPLEWDWTSLPPETAPAELDSSRLKWLRALRSLLVATWCFAQPGRSPEVDRAGRQHLDRVMQVGLGP
jgi:hypothetical protein